jgi:hypothetical protein
MKTVLKLIILNQYLKGAELNKKFKTEIKLPKTGFFYPYEANFSG